MRNILFMLCLVALITGCKNHQIDKANTLLSKKTELQFGIIEKLDSVIGFPESFEMIVKSVNISTDADSLLKKRMTSLSELKKQGNTDLMNSLAIRTKDEVTGLIYTALHYKQSAATNDLKNEAKGVKKDFLGWKYESKNDTCSYVIYFDKDVSTILGIEKK